MKKEKMTLKQKNKIIIIKAFKSFSLRLALLATASFFAIVSEASGFKTLFLTFENYNEKTLELIIKTQDTTIYHSLRKKKKALFVLPYSNDSTFSIKIIKRPLFKKPLCYVNDFASAIYNESNCTKTKTFMIDVILHKSKARGNGGLYFRSCCEGKYIDKTFYWTPYYFSSYESCIE